MTATFSATVMVHSCVGVGLTAGHFVPRLRGNDEELRNSGDKCVIPEIGFACNVGFVLRFCALLPQLLRDRLFECVEPHPGFRTR
jgi:hypothetical protein